MSHRMTPLRSWGITLAHAALAGVALAGAALVWAAPARAQIGSESVGMNTHVPSDDVLDACVDLGIEWVRVDANWRDIHRGPGSFDTSEMERVARSASARGLSVFMTLAYTPDWVPRVPRTRTDTYGGNDEPATSAEWVAFVDAFVRRMRPLGVRHFGLWNEANLGGFWEEDAGLDAWVDKIVLPGAAAVRAACADCVVLGPELANVGPSDVALDQILSRTPDTWDIVTHHIYQSLRTSGGGDSFESALDRRRSPLTRASLRELLDLHGIDREVWITETGYRADPPGDADEERAQRDYVTGVLGLQLTYGWWTNTFFYEIYDCGVDQPGCDIDGFGLLRPGRAITGGPRSWPGDYRQKPAFTAMRDMLAAQPALLGEGPVRACGNGADDDGDGRTDLADRGCLSQIDDSETGEPPRRELAALRNPTPVALDGRLDEWSADGFVTLGPTDWFASAIGLLGPVISTDLGVELGARWEGDTLFLAVRVGDADHVAAEPNERLYLDDSLQVAFDPAATGGRGYDADDEEWGCIARPGGLTRFAGDGAGVLCATSRERGTTSYELAVPAAALPEARYAAGERLRFSMLVNEDDGAATRDGTGREGWLELTRSIGARKEPESFAELVFEDRVALDDVDAGRPAGEDAGLEVGDGGGATGPAPAGCGCRVGSTRPSSAWGLLGLAGIATLAARRRRARATASVSGALAVLASSGCAPTPDAPPDAPPDAAALLDAAPTPDAPAPDAWVEPWAPPPQCATLGSGEPTAGVAVRGHAFSFTTDGGRIEGAYVTSLEHPDWCVRTGAEGAFEVLGVPVGSDLTLRIHHPDYVVVQTGTHTVPAEGMERLTFQVPTHGIYTLLSRFVALEPDPTRCQIAGTITEIGRSLYPSEPYSPSHGEAGATVSIAPTPAEADGPIYFDYVSPSVIVPDRDLTETTRDGGILYLNVTPGDYVLSASKDGVTFRDVRVRCIAGMLVNPSPPWSLQAYVP